MEKATRFIGKAVKPELYFNNNEIEQYDYVLLSDATKIYEQKSYLSNQARKAIFVMCKKTRTIRSSAPTIRFYMFNVLIRPILR